MNNITSSFRTILVFILLSIVGASLIPKLNIQLAPSRSYSSVSITCFIPNTSIEIVELEVTALIEGTLASLKGIQEISSVSGNGYSTVNISLDKWTDPEKFRLEASSTLRQLFPKLPKNASYPLINVNRPDKNKASDYLMAYTINSPDNANEIVSYIKSKLRPSLSTIKGIDRIVIEGDQSAQIALQTSSSSIARLRDKNDLDDNRFQEIISTGLESTNLGTFRQENTKIAVLMENSLNQIDAFESYPVATIHDRIIRMGSVANYDIEDTPLNHYVRINGEENVSIHIYPEEHVNTLQLAKHIREKMATMETALPDGYRLALAYDGSEPIKDELHKIYTRTLLSLSILLCFVLLITRRANYLAIIFSSLLVNILLSFICYYLFGLEIHLYSIAGVTLSLGLVVDNAIVIIEDLRHTGRNRIFPAILASTFTAIGALSVIYLLEENQRLLLLDFALTIIINLLISLPIAYFFIPAMLDKLPVNIKSKQTKFRRKRKLLRLTNLYCIQLRIMLRFRKSLIFCFVLAFGLPIFLLPENIDQDDAWSRLYNATFGSKLYNSKLREPLNRFLGGSLFLFTGNQSARNQYGTDPNGRTRLQVSISMPKGATLSQMDQVVRHFERHISQYRHQLDVFTTYVINANHANISISFKKSYENSLPYTLKQSLEALAITEGAAEFAIYGVGRGFSNTLNINDFDSSITLKGYNYQQLKTLAIRVRDSLVEIPRVQNILISSQERYNLHPAVEYQVDIGDLEQLYLRNIRKNDISSALNQSNESAIDVGFISTAGSKSMNVRWYHNRNTPIDVWEIMNAPIQLSDSAALRMVGLGIIEPLLTTDDIVRKNQEYILNVHYRFGGTYELNKLITERLIKGFKKNLPFGYTIYNSSYRDWQDTESTSYLWSVAMVLLIIYIICAALLESFKQPLAVIAMIPFSFIGVFLVYHILKLRFDQGAYAALLMVSALITNTALYVINDLNFFYRDKSCHHHTSKKNGIKVYARALNAKAMPIFVTTSAAILSMLPFMISGDEQGFWFTISAGTIGGLLFSLIGAYILLPLCLIKNPN